MKKTMFFFGLILLVLAFYPNSALAGVPEAVTYLNAQDQSAWTTQALVAANVSGLTGDHLKNVSSNNAIDYAAPILAITALGENPRTYPNTNYIEALKGFWDGTQLGDAGTLNDDIFGLLALISSGESTNNTVVDGIKEYLLLQQNQDGGWGFLVGGGSDTNMTSMAIMALLEAGLTSSDTEITNAVTYIQNAQNDDGGFPYDPTSPWGDSDASSDAWVISAIYALGQNPEAGDWVSDSGYNPVEHLLTLQTEAGLFEYQTGTGEDGFSPVTTSYAVIALRGKSFPVGYYELPAQGPALNVHLVIRGEGGIICDTNIGADTAMNTVVNAASSCGLTYNIQDTNYLNQINDDAAEGMVGWLYYVNSVEAAVGAADYSLSEGDEVLWYYGEWGWENTTLEAGGESEVAVTVLQPLTITVPDTVTDATINVSSLTSDDGVNTTATLPEITLSATTNISATPIEVVIPDGAVITAPAGWNGVINAPRIESNNSVTIIPDSGYRADVSAVIEVGSGDIELLFSKAVRLLIPGASGKLVGYSREGNFTKITNICSDEIPPAVEAGGDCKIDSGADLVIWTKHFTKFIVYDQNILATVIINTPAAASTEEQEDQCLADCNEEEEEEPDTATSTEEDLVDVQDDQPEVSDATESAQEQEDEHVQTDILEVVSEAGIIAFGDVNEVITAMGLKRDLAQEKEYRQTIVAQVINREGASKVAQNSITNFVTYGTKATKKLGAGERAGVINSYKTAFNRLPDSEEDWNDIIKIAQGEMPSRVNTASEAKAMEIFSLVYSREADRSDINDNSAIEMIAYGQRPLKRDLDKEREGIKVFQAVYGHNPATAVEWDTVRALAYSGAER